MEEIFDIVDPGGRIIGKASRREVHSNPDLIHRVVHLLVFNNKGELLLQKRSMNKDIAPGKWDTSVGGHVNSGEDIQKALKREAEEELGIGRCHAEFLYTYLFKNHRESELVSTFRTVHEGEFRFDRREIESIRFWSINEIKENLGNGILSNYFEKEFSTFLNKGLIP